jgi:hypothetical protein
MPPFDPFNGETPLAVMIRLSNERDRTWRFTKKGDKRPRQDVEAAMAGRKSAQARRAAESGEPSIATRRKV